MNFLKKLIKEIGDENTSLASDGTSSADFTGYIDTGSLVFNAALSGSLFGGMPNNKILALAGEYATGKTYFALGLVRYFFETYPEAAAGWYMSESAVTKDMFIERGIDPDRVMRSEIQTVEEWKFGMVKAVDLYLQIEEPRPPFLMVLDSLGNLSTNKELSDAEAGKDVLDMTRAKTIRSAFRTISLKIAKANMPLVVTNHTYAQMDQYKPRMMGGGGGLMYNADIIAFLSKSKDKDDKTKQIHGDIIHVETQKNRFAAPFTKVDVYLNYQKGLDRYYGLMDLALKYNVIQKRSAGSKGNIYTLPSGEELKRQQFTPAIWDVLLEQIDEGVKQDFKYGGGGGAPEVSEEETE